MLYITTAQELQKTLSGLSYDKYVMEFGRLFTEGFRVQPEISEAVFKVRYVSPILEENLL